MHHIVERKREKKEKKGVSTGSKGHIRGDFYRPMSSTKMQAKTVGKVTEEDKAEQNRIRGFAQAARGFRQASSIGVIDG